MSPIYDMNAVNEAPDDNRKHEGVYHAEITGAVGKVSTTGKQMITFELLDVEDRRRLCFDRMMLEGKPFALTMTKNKLKALGVDLSKPLDPASLNGLRCWVAVAYGKENDKGQAYLEPNMKAKGTKFGYYEGEPQAEPVDESQASNLFVGKQPAPLPRGQTAPWPAGVTKATDLPEDHPDFNPF